MRCNTAPLCSFPTDSAVTEIKVAVIALQAKQRIRPTKFSPSEADGKIRTKNSETVQPQWILLLECRAAVGCTAAKLRRADQLSLGSGAWSPLL